MSQVSTSEQSLLAFLVGLLLHSPKEDRASIIVLGWKEAETHQVSKQCMKAITILGKISLEEEDVAGAIKELLKKGPNQLLDQVLALGVTNGEPDAV